MTKAAIASPLALKVTLPPRERQCLELLAVGFSLDQIREELGIAKGTVAETLSNARKRLGAKTNSQAVAIAVTHRLLIS